MSVIQTKKKGFTMDTKGPVENGTRHEEAPSTSAAMLKTTTISTIAVQSGKTRIVIALLHVSFFAIYYSAGAFLGG